MYIQQIAVDFGYVDLLERHVFLSVLTVEGHLTSYAMTNGLSHSTQDTNIQWAPSVIGLATLTAQLAVPWDQNVVRTLPATSVEMDTAIKTGLAPTLTTAVPPTLTVSPLMEFATCQHPTLLTIVLIVTTASALEVALTRTAALKTTSVTCQVTSVSWLCVRWIHSVLDLTSFATLNMTIASSVVVTALLQTAAVQVVMMTVLTVLTLSLSVTRCPTLVVVRMTMIAMLATSVTLTLTLASQPVPTKMNVLALMRSAMLNMTIASSVVAAVEL